MNTSLRRTARPHPAQDLLTQLQADLDSLERRQLLRGMTVLDAAEGSAVSIRGRRIVCFCLNDYLGLSRHPRVSDAAARSARDWGVGARASRLLAGTTRIHEALEGALAEWHGAARALVYSSGFLANLGTITSLVSAGDCVLIDRLSHASLIDAARASRATLKVFRHNDVGQVRALLGRAGGSRRSLVITEGVFSMDGDAAPLRELAEAAGAHGALVYVDDAHGAFVRGRCGRGSLEAAGLDERSPVVYMATLGKALGSQGGFVAGPAALIRTLENRARSFIYSTALAVPAAAAALEALRLLGEEPWRRASLEARARQLHAGLRERGFRTPATASHIAPVVVGAPASALALAEVLWDRGLWCPAIRPPTVPAGTSRLRLSLTADHREEDVEAVLGALGSDRARRILKGRVRRGKRSG
ncbi:MAG TPA: 8-amino-7-oxononanoate synthase [bacterium]